MVENVLILVIRNFSRLQWESLPLSNECPPGVLMDLDLISFANQYRPNAPAVTKQSLEGSRLRGTSPALEANSFRLGDHPGNDHVVSGTEFPGARQHVIVLSAIPSQVLRTGLHTSGVPVASVPVFVAYQVSEVSRSSNLISRVSRIKSRASIAAAP
jgi:hypothetical protein